MSRGSRAKKSRVKSILQPFRPLHLSWSGKGDMPTLTGVESATAKLPVIAGAGLPSAFYMNELLVRLLHRFDVQEEIYRLYESTLYRLHDQQRLEASLRLFEKQLLDYLGFALNLSTDAESGEPVNTGAQYMYHVEHGPVLFSGMPEGPQPMISGESLLAYEQGCLTSPEVLRELKRLMRHVLAFYLEGRPLKSRELFR